MVADCDFTRSGRTVVHKQIWLAAGLAVLSIHAAHAVELTDCHKGGTNARLNCLEKDIVLLNSSFQINIAALKQENVDLKQQVDDLKKKVDAIPIPDLSNVVRRGDTFKLGFVNQNRCLSYPTGESGGVAGTSPAIPVDLLALQGDCSGSPSLQFR
jgi:hypothetical protein